MKKIIKNRIFIVIITLIIGTSLGVYGANVYSYQAREISYTPSNGETMNVNDALNELYDKCGNSSSVPEPVSFAEDSWETIVANVKLGNTSKYKVGDTKEIELTGFTNEEEGSNGLYTIRIANTSTPDECLLTDFSQTACGFVIEFVDIITEYQMNSSVSGSTSANKRGWKLSLMRTYVNDTIYNALPEKLRENIIDTFVLSGNLEADTNISLGTNDKIYLLSTKEIWGTSLSSDIGATETRQLDCYDSLGVTIDNYLETIKKYNGLNSSWWLRSSSNSYACSFYYVIANGSSSSSYYDGINALGVAPAFRIG